MPFARWSGAYGGEWGAERVVFTGEDEPISYVADEEDRVMIDRDTVERLGSIEAMRAQFAAADFVVPPAGRRRASLLTALKLTSFLSVGAQSSPLEGEGFASLRDGLRVEREAPDRPSWRSPVTKSVQKITLSSSRDIPFDKLLLSQSNVRHVKAGVSLEELAEDIAQRTLIHGLSVRAVVDADGIPTGMFEIPAGGRRYRALELLVKQKRLARTAPVPCVVREGGIAEEDSLAENVQRAPLHPLDQFRAFLSLREKGESEEEIAAAFFISVSVVKQRLRLASVSPKCSRSMPRTA